MLAPEPQISRIRFYTVVLGADRTHLTENSGLGPGECEGSHISIDVIKGGAAVVRAVTSIAEVHDRVEEALNCEGMRFAATSLTSPVSPNATGDGSRIGQLIFPIGFRTN